MNASGLDLARRLDAGESLASITLSRLSPPARATLLRCAVPRVFDASTYDAVLRADGGPELHQLLDREYVENGYPGHRMVEDMRAAALDAWWLDAGAQPLTTPVPPALVEFARGLAAHLRARGEDVEALHALRLVDEDEAAELVRALGREADAVLDIAGYQKILDALVATDRPTPGPGLAALRGDRLAYFEARAMWEAEWCQSARYLPRPPAEVALRRLLDDEGPRVLLLQARGGMGKTMQMRWFVARHCVPEPLRVPCALVDFDRIEPVKAMRYPWLVLLEIASQLDQQVPGGYFADLLASDGVFLPMLQRHTRKAVSTLHPGAVDGAEVLARFVSSLAAVATGTPVVVVLDTLEEALLRPAGDPGALLEVLSDLLDAVPGLRLVLSGRYDLQGRLGPFARRHPHAEPLNLGPFAPAEAGRYLTTVRGLHRPDVVDAIVAQSEGVPFTLALFADFLGLAPATTAAEITAFEQPRLMYVIERIVERIAEPGVRWLLRYGVVPRRLSFDFLTGVVAPQLADSMAGTSPHDHPERDQRPVDRSIRIWPTDVPVPESPAAWRALWDELCRYANTSSWVSPDGPDAVSFHEAVLEPLRELLRPHPVFRLLHADAAAFFERRAREQPHEWSAAIREAVYHRFQAEGPAAEAFWGAAVAEAWRSHGPITVAEVAGEVLGTEYLDDDGPRWFRSDPSQARSVPLLSWQTVADARIELADALVARALADGAGPGDELWSSAERELRTARRLGETRRDVALQDVRHAVVAARILVDARRDAARAHTLLDAVRDRPMTHAQRARWAHVLGDALRQVGGPEVHYEQAYQLARRAGDGGDGVVPIVLSAADLELERGDVTVALTWVERARAAAVGDRDRAAVLIAHAAALTRAARPYEALRVLDDLPCADARGLLTTARAQLVAKRAADAVATCSQGLDAVSGPAGAELAAALLACRGLAHGQLLAFGPAVDDLVAAHGQARHHRDRRAATRYSLAAAQLLLHEVGDLGEAAERLTEAREIASGDPAARLQIDLLQAELRSRLGGEDAARDLLDRMPELSARPGPLTRQMIEIAVSALIAGPEERAVPLLAGALTQVRPAGARSAMLWRLAHASRTLGGVPGGVADGAPPDIVALLEPDGDAGPQDGAVQRLLRAGLLHVLGEHRAAAADAGAAMRVLADSPSAVLAGLRAGGELPSGVELPREASIRGAAALLLAGNAFAAGDLPSAVGLCDEAVLHLGRSTRRNGWQARALELKGDLAAAGGDGREARHIRAQAAAAYAALGDEPAHAATMQRIGADIAAGQARAVRQDFAELRLREPAGPRGDVEVGWTWPGQETAPTVTVPAPALGLPWPARDALQKVVARLDADPGGWAATAGQWLLGDRGPGGWGLGGPGSGSAELRLDLAPVAAILPWELVRDPVSGVPLLRHPAVRLVHRQVRGPVARQVRHLQRALNRVGATPPLDVDGIVGPATAAALRAFQSRTGVADGVAGANTWSELAAELRHAATRPLRVVVLQPSAEGQIAQRRGSEYRGVADAARQYAALGAQVLHREVGAADLAMHLVGEIRSFRPDVLHLGASVRRSGGAVMLDFGGPVDPVGLHVTAINEMARSTSSATAAPLVVLDTDTPPSRPEAVRALLLRNEFAHRLVALGDIDAVLAAGLLDEPDPQRPAVPTLLASRYRPADVLRALHDGVAADTDLPAALVTAVPTYVLLPEAL
ncbi:peptidoglycan-binding protein [Pseudonocardia nigra]|uniref:peptidoglycan-binding protein n=1 Tax=Pseudonocardia nigra TaxID=1921578 RepID=UPI001C5F4296|nr:peptidoglycan-binding domain-containing protein [Pseudonocardia nigra]